MPLLLRSGASRAGLAADRLAVLVCYQVSSYLGSIGEGKASFILQSWSYWHLRFGGVFTYHAKPSQRNPVHSASRDACPKD
jgi:hypothetical protein